MSNEKPKDPSKQEPSAVDVPVDQKRELSEDEQQTAKENAAREQFIKEWVMTSELSAEQKVFVVDYVNKMPGAWREYNGDDFKVVSAVIEGGVWKVSFGLFFDDYEAQRVDEVIPLSG
jgi:hypothetical protein